MRCGKCNKRLTPEDYSKDFCSNCGQSIRQTKKEGTK